MAASASRQPALEVPAGGGAPDTPYPRFDVAGDDKWALDWDDKTRRLVRERVEQVPPYRFFTPDQAALLEAICDCLIPQDDRPPGARVPIAPWIDERLHRGAGDGYRFESMPTDGKAYRLGLQGIDEAARARHHMAFLELDPEQRSSIIAGVAAGQTAGPAWERLPAARFFSLLMNDVVTTYYAHPAAWAEIGFNGPSSPRGHMRLSLGRRDPWEAAEERPRSSVDIVRSAKGSQGKSGQGKGGSGATQ